MYSIIRGILPTHMKTKRDIESITVSRKSTADENVTVKCGHHININTINMNNNNKNHIYDVNYKKNQSQ